MIERLQKILSARGVASRRAAEQMIREGRVTVNGRVSVLGESADGDADEILLDGKQIPSRQDAVYIMLNKPRGYVTTLKDEKGRRDVSQLVSDCGKWVYPVGRLDMDSEGLLLFTNDGAFANSLTHPKHEVKKTYLVTVTGYSEQGLARLKSPMRLDGYVLRVPEVCCKAQDPQKPDSAVLEITIHEGRNRQVRRMCAIANMQVRRLVRIAEGGLMLGSLKSGTWRYLTRDEVAALRK